MKIKRTVCLLVSACMALSLTAAPAYAQPLASSVPESSSPEQSAPPESSSLSQGLTTVREESSGEIRAENGPVRLYRDHYTAAGKEYSFDPGKPLLLTGTAPETYGGEGPACFLTLMEPASLQLELRDLTVARPGDREQFVPFDLGSALTDGEAQVTLTLSGDNILEASSGRPAILVPGSTALTVGGDGSLHLTGTESVPSLGAFDGSCGSITLTGGVLEVSGGLGEHWQHRGASVTITGGTLRTQGSIEGQKGVEISGGKVFAKAIAGPFSTTDKGTAFISLTGSVGDRAGVEQWRGFLAEENGQTVVYGDQTLPEDWTVDRGLLVAPGAKLTLAEGTALTNESIINVAGTLDLTLGSCKGNGPLILKEGGTLLGAEPTDPKSFADPVLTLRDGDVLFISGDSYLKNHIEYPYSGRITLTGAAENAAVTLEGGTADKPLTVSLKEVELTGTAPMAVTGPSAAELKLTGVNRLISTGDQWTGGAALAIGEEAALTLSGASIADVLHVENLAGAQGAAIGGGDPFSAPASGSLTIRSCTVEALSSLTAIGSTGGELQEGPAIVLENAVVLAQGSEQGGSIRAGTITMDQVLYTEQGGRTGRETAVPSGILYRDGTGRVSGSGALPFDFENPRGSTLFIGKDAVLTLGEGRTLTNNGTIILEGTLSGGTLANFGETAVCVGGENTALVTENPVKKVEAMTPKGLMLLEGADRARMDGEVLTIEGNVSLKGVAGQPGEPILVTGGTEGAPVVLQADTLDLRGSGALPALAIGENSHVRIVLRGRSTFDSFGCTGGLPGLLVPESSSVTLACAEEAPGHLCDESCGSLLARGSGSGEGSSGVGGKTGAAAGTVITEGGNLRTEANGGAGVGAARDGSCKAVVLRGGNIDTDWSGIRADSVLLSGGTVRTAVIETPSFSTGEAGSAVVCAGGITDSSFPGEGTMGIFSVDGGRSYLVYGQQSRRGILEGNVTIPQGSSLTVEPEQTLTIRGQLTNSGSISCGGTLLTEGVLINHGSFSAGGSVQVTGRLENQSAGELLIGEKGSLLNSGTVENSGKLISRGRLENQEGKTFRNGKDAVLETYGTFENKGFLVNRGTVTGTVSGSAPCLKDLPYRDPMGEQLEQITPADTAVFPVTGETQRLTEGWWAVPAGAPVELAGGLETTGQVHLILEDDSSLLLGDGLVVGPESTLTLYGQSRGTGSLNAKDAEQERDILVNGTLLLLGGSLSGDPEGKSLCGADAEAGTIQIAGGRLEARGTETGLKAGDLTASAGVLLAEGETHGLLGTLKTTETGRAFVCVSSLSEETGSESWKGFLSRNGGADTVVLGDQTISGEAVLPGECTLTVGRGQSLTITGSLELKEGSVLTAEEGAELRNQGRILQRGTLNGTVSGYAADRADLTWYDPLTGEEQALPKGELARAVRPGERVLTGGWWYLPDGVTELPGRLEITGAVQLILCDDAVLEAAEGVHIAGENALTLWGQRAGTGMVHSGASVGCNEGESAGSFTLGGGVLSVENPNGTALGGEGMALEFRSGQAHLTGSTALLGAVTTAEQGNAVIMTESPEYRYLLTESDRTAWSGIFYEGQTGTVYGSPSWGQDLEIPAGKKLLVPPESSLTMEEGFRLINSGTLVRGGPIEGQIEGGGRYVQAPASISYRDPSAEEEAMTRTTPKDQLVIPLQSVSPGEPCEWGPGWYLVQGQKTIAAPLEFRGTVNLILAEGAELSALEGLTADGDLILWTRSEEDGSLRVEGGPGAGAITAHDVIVNGGTLTAQGRDSTQPGISAARIAINGGKVNGTVSTTGEAEVPRVPSAEAASTEMTPEQTAAEP